jgi:protein-L-isoaspartate O-methyltransferase
LIENLKHAKKVLDIGTGSGFMTAAMAHVAPDDCSVIGVDHI